MKIEVKFVRHISGARFICCSQDSIFVLSNLISGGITRVSEINPTTGAMKNILTLWGITPTGFDMNNSAIKIAISYGGTSFKIKHLEFLYGLSGGLLITSKGWVASVWATLKIIWNFIEILSAFVFVLIKGLYKRKIEANYIKDEIDKIKFHGVWRWATGVRFDPVDSPNKIVVATATTVYHGSNGSTFETVLEGLINCVHIAPLKQRIQSNYLLVEGHLHVPDLWIKSTEKKLGAIWQWNMHENTKKLWKGFISVGGSCASVPDRQGSLWVCYLKLNKDGQNKCYLSPLNDPAEEFECETLDNPYYVSNYYENSSFLVCDKEGIKIVSIGL